MTSPPSRSGSPRAAAAGLVAAFLRYIQVHGVYTPGPLFLLCLITGLAGSVLAFIRRPRYAAARPTALACLFFWATGVFVLGLSDLFEFTWRYQIPALVTLPPAGALGIGALVLAIRKPREAAAPETVPGRAPEMATPAP